MNIWHRSSTHSFLNKRSRLVIPIGFLILILSFVAALLVGAADFSFFDAAGQLLRGDVGTEGRILLYVRLPRAVAACLAGAALAVSGTVIQAVLNNAMASPSIIGVNAGAGFGVSLLTALMPAAVALIPAAAFIGAALTGMLIYFIASRTGASRMTITLTGIAVSSLLTAMMSGVKAIFPHTAYDISAFSVGGLSGISANTLKIAGIAIVLCLAIAFVFSKKIDLLSFGEDVAHSLGMNVKMTRLLLLILAGALAGLAVSFAGLLGFVGLVIPHVARRLTGNRHSLLIPASALLGSSFLLICDTLSRILFAPYEFPAGILLSLIGAPFFIAVILTSRGGRSYD